ncbi:LysR family transcriptional regulator [Pseudorhodoferax soli]|uniref:DNA-binding transcriptional LysR family regulator n=1 Tax=Pseudorhodoferax soli TaxID=545864 RepID=A0A368XA61_9BURK|nr:LysR family transcriptional regulator [Pseudorhodoferax soli]RCW64126.1 DNA-binding transcriptional LysR family regulator [Pseudorhodoferax soli]
MTVAALRGVDLRRIRHFVVLAETLNFHRAAQLLHMTQPPLTVSIQKLETELGVRLFERSAKGVRLTPSGEAALDAARQMLHHAAAFSEMAALAQSGMAGLLRVGFVGSATHGLLQRLIPRFRAEHPQVELLLRDSSSMQILRGLAEESIDIGLLWTPVLDAMGAEFLTLQRQTLVAALPQGHPLARRRSLVLADLQGENFILYDRTQAEGMRSVCMLLCQRAGFVPRAAQEAIQIQTVLALVQTGLGIALVPSMMAELPNAQLVFRPLRDLADQALVALALAYRPGSSKPAVQRMRQLAAQEFGE